MSFAEITTEAELREALGGYPKGRAAAKVRPELHPLQVEWLKVSPFCVVATSDAAGNCDASPKGDPAGRLIHVLDPRTIVIAERPGNDTLRINGRARLVRDAPFFDDLAVRGQRPVLALVVEIDQVFSHCPKAFMRSDIWEPATWKPDALPTTAALCKAVQEPAETLEELEAHYVPESYARELY